MVGSAGSGKGTQSDLLEEQLGYHKVEAGAVFRKVAKEDTPLGRKVKAINDAGEHASDELITELLKEYIDSVSDDEPVLIDGYPRTVGQKKMLGELLTSIKRDPENVLAIWIKVDREEAERRLLNRSQCSVCKTVFMNRNTDPCPHCGGEVKPRDYDQPEAIKHRLDFFEEKVIPAIEEYRSEDKLIEVNGMQEVVHVFDEIKAKLAERMPAEEN
jgi:adenylate kinase